MLLGEVTTCTVRRERPEVKVRSTSKRLALREGGSDWQVSAADAASSMCISIIILLKKIMSHSNHLYSFVCNKPFI